MAEGGKYGKVHTERDLRALIAEALEMELTTVPEDLTDLEIKAVEHGHVFQIGVAEPVFLLRGQDELAPDTIDYYRQRCIVRNSPPHHVRGVGVAHEAFVGWGGEHETKTPSSDGFEPDPAA
jgi:hypothetical protein